MDKPIKTGGVKMWEKKGKNLDNNLTEKEVKGMRKLGLIVVALMVTGMLLPNISLAWEVTSYNYSYGGTLISSARYNGDTKISETRYLGTGKIDTTTSFGQGANTVTTYNYNLDGTTTARSIVGTGTSPGGDQTTFINAYGQDVLTYDTNSSGPQWYFIGDPDNDMNGNDPSGNPYATQAWTDANGNNIDLNGDGTKTSAVAIQRAGGLAAYQAALAAGVATSKDASGNLLSSNFDPSSHLNMAITNGKAIRSVTVFNADGSQTTYGFSPTGSAGHAIVNTQNSTYVNYVTSVVTKEVNGKIRGNSVTGLGDPADYTTHSDQYGKYFDPIVNVRGALGKDQSGNFTLTVNGATSTLQVGDARQIERLNGLLGNAVNLTVDDLGNGTYSLFSINP